MTRASLNMRSLNIGALPFVSTRCARAAADCGSAGAIATAPAFVLAQPWRAGGAPRKRDRRHPAAPATIKNSPPTKTEARRGARARIQPRARGEGHRDRAPRGGRQA